jgi:hypothetical protein
VSSSRRASIKLSSTADALAAGAAAMALCFLDIANSSISLYWGRLTSAGSEDVSSYECAHNDTQRTARMLTLPAITRTRLAARRQQFGALDQNTSAAKPAARYG